MFINAIRSRCIINRAKRALGLLLVLFSVVGVSAAFQDSSDPATNITLASLIQTIYGFNLSPKGYLMVQMPDNSTKQVKTPGFMRFQVSTGWLVITGLELVEDTESVAADLRNLKTRTPGSAPTYIVVCYTDKNGNVTSYKSGTLDPKSPVTSLDSFYVSAIPTDGSWPIIDAISWSGYMDGSDKPQWMGGIRWSTQIDTSTMHVIQRAPSAITKTTSTGSGGYSLLHNERLSPTQVSIADDVNSYTYSCSDPCVVDGQALMLLWQPPNP